MNYVGLDVHKDFVQACITDESGAIVKEGRFDTTGDGLSALVRETSGASCVMESSTACFRVYDFLTASGVKVRVAHPLKIKAIASAKLKNDKVDARMLAHLERCDLIPESHVPTVEVRQLRDLIQRHVSLTRQRTGEVNKVRSLLLRNNAFYKGNISTKKGLAFLESFDGAIGFLLLQSKRQLEFINSELKLVSELIVEQAKHNEDAVILQSIPGVGSLSALLVAAHIDGVQRFPDAEHLASYAGLVPRVRQSGNSLPRSGPITKQGNPLIRWILVQDAWQVVSRIPYFKQFYRNISVKRGKNKAIVAVARKLLRVMYFMLVKRQTFDERLLCNGRKNTKPFRSSPRFDAALSD